MKEKPPSKKGRNTNRGKEKPTRGVKSVMIKPSSDPMALLQACGISKEEFREFAIGLAAEWYPGLGKGPGMRLYDDNRPTGWPASETLCTAFRQKKNTTGWEVWMLTAINLVPATVNEAMRYAWTRRRTENPIDMLSDRERFACRNRGRLEERTRRRPECRNATNRPSYREDRAGAVLQWRPLMEWRPGPGGEWGYVKIGEYSVWLLI